MNKPNVDVNFIDYIFQRNPNGKLLPGVYARHHHWSTYYYFNNGRTIILGKCDHGKVFSEKQQKCIKVGQ